jgi:hypothetical protein
MSPNTEIKNQRELKDITPDTRVGELLKNYPELEQTLIDCAPAFKKLRNPILRRTVARVTSLRQAAIVGSVSLGELINKLREKAGLSPSDVSADQESRPQTHEEPTWVSELPLVKSLDACPIIENGGHPLDRVMKDLSSLEVNQRYELITPFVPAPLIDVAQNKGFIAWSQQISEIEVKTWFKKK